MKKWLKSLTASVLAAGLLASAQVGMTVNAADTTGAVTVEGDYMSNEYIKLGVRTSGRFALGTTGGDPATDSDNDKKMMYGFPSSSTSYTTVAVDDNAYEYSSGSLTTRPAYDANEKCNTSAGEFDKISVTQKLSFIRNISTARDDVLEIKYIVKNTDTKSHNVGLRIMIDTMLGSNDYAPFRVAGVGDVTTETEFTGDNIPQYWQAFDSLTNPTVISQGTFLRYGDTNKPDKVQFANWSRVKNKSWDYQINEGYSNGDSAVTVTWDKKPLAAGKTRTYTTYYGLSELTQDLMPPLAVSVYGDNTLTYTSTDAQGLPNYSTLAVTAYIQNIGTADAENATAKIVLPTGFTLANGSNTVSLGTINVNGSKQATWNVKVAGNTPAGSHPIKIVCDSDQTDAKTVQRFINVPSVIVNKSKLSANNIVIGDTVTATAAATGGSGSFRYAFYYKRASESSWSTIQDFGTAKTATVKPLKATDYQVLVKIKDENGTISDKLMPLKVNPVLANTSTMSAASIEVGQTAKALSSATGGIAPYQYSVLYKKTAETNWTSVQTFSDTAETAVAPAEAGEYNVCIKVKDTKGTVEKKYFKLEVKNAPLANKSTISATATTLGASVTVKGAATGGQAPYQYAVLCKKTSDSQWTVKQNYSDNATVAFKPAKATTYNVCIKVKDNTGAIEKKYFTLKVSALKNTSTISAETASVGDTVNIKASATGGTGTYQYQILYKRSSLSDWIEMKAYNTTAAHAWKPLAATNYDICVNVKDKTGVVAQKIFKVTVKSSLENTSTLSLGSAFTIKCSAKGGTAPYQYQILYKRATASQWVTKQDYSTTASASIKVTEGITYMVRINVKDSKGTVVSRTFTAGIG